jgi:GNAT superfamily N-acetyltransferase
MSVIIKRATAEHVPIIAEMAGELLHEIMQAIEAHAFQFNLIDATVQLTEFIAQEKYYVFVAMNEVHPPECSPEVGFIALYESQAIYADGRFGTIPEFYVRPSYRKKKIGQALLQAAKKFGIQRGWKRLEVTTPPLPQYQSTLDFYECEGFAVSGGRKLQIGL